MTRGVHAAQVALNSQARKKLRAHAETTGGVPRCFVTMGSKHHGRIPQLTPRAARRAVQRGAVEILRSRRVGRHSAPRRRPLRGIRELETSRVWKACLLLARRARKHSGILVVLVCGMRGVRATVTFVGLSFDRRPRRGARLRLRVARLSRVCSVQSRVSRASMPCLIRHHVRPLAISCDWRS